MTEVGRGWRREGRDRSGKGRGGGGRREGRDRSGKGVEEGGS